MNTKLPVLVDKQNLRNFEGFLVLSTIHSNGRNPAKLINNIFPPQRKKEFSI